MKEKESEREIEILSERERDGVLSQKSQRSAHNLQLIFKYFIVSYIILWSCLRINRFVNVITAFRNVLF